MGRIVPHMLGLVLLTTLQACGSPPPPPPPPTVAKLTLSADPDANATAAGQGAPTIIRVYQLAAAAGFEKAEFFRLLNGDAAVLGPDMIKRDEYLLAPGTKREETISPPDKVQALGVFAAYREFQSRNWRVVIPLPPNKTTQVQVTVAAAGLVVAKSPAP
jgi:type VI secretion system protein VasD